MPSSEPAVSVIMIFRDAGRFIADAIHSVEAQTFTDWELVLVDDGSTDGTWQTLERLARAGGHGATVEVV